MNPHRHVLHTCAGAGLLLLLMAALAGAEPAAAPDAPEQPAGNRINPVISIEVEHPIMTLGAPPAVAKTALEVTTWQFPKNAKLTFQWRQLQDEMLPDSVKVAEAPIRFSDATAQRTKATLPRPGVYTLAVTVTDSVSKQVWRRNAWINVWDGRVQLNAAGKPDPATLMPGILPPTSVRQFKPDPGPFAHPRLYCTPFDWAEINARCVQGKVQIAGSAWKNLQGRAMQVIEGKSPTKALYRDLESWAAAHFAGKAPDLAAEVPTMVMKPEDRVSYVAYDLLCAGFFQWARIDPALPWKDMPPQDQVVCRRLAVLLAAACKSYLDANWTPGDERNPRGTLHQDYVGFSLRDWDQGPFFENFWRNMALAYDFISPWMTSSEQRAARSMLFVGGVGRYTWRTAKTFKLFGSRWGTVVDWRGVNGDGGTWSNFGEHVVFLSAVVAGEESGVEPAVLRAFGKPPIPDADLSDNPKDPYPESLTWPHARKTDINNLVRQIRAMRHVLTPNGFYTYGDEEAYGLFWPLKIYPASLGLLRQGAHNQFITGPNYRMVNHVIYNLYASSKKNETYTSIPRHSGNGDHRSLPTLLLKYLYPDDPAVGFIHSLRHGMPTNSLDSPARRISFETCIFGMDPSIPKIGVNALAEVAKVKALPVTKVDRECGRVVLRSDWSDAALMADLDVMPNYGGHATFAANTFSLLALGRSWSAHPGYHKIYSTWHSGISVLNPEWSSCPLTKGFVGINLFYPPAGYTAGRLQSTGGVKLLDASESSDGLWSLAVGDATTQYCAKTKDGTLFQPSAMQHAIRSLVVVRGKHPYALVIDDIRKDSQNHTWRWTMNNTERVAGNDSPFAMDLLPGATATEGVLAHQQDLGDGPDLPRLLVRDLSERDLATQPAMAMDRTQFTVPKGLEHDFYLKHQVNLLVLERRQAVEPNFKILLFPFRTGEPLPTTTWNQERTELTIDHRNGMVDTIRFSRKPSDPRTYVAVSRKP